MIKICSGTVLQLDFMSVRFVNGGRIFVNVSHQQACAEHTMHVCQQYTHTMMKLINIQL